MTVYSHSRLATYEQCPLKFKLGYIDKAKPEFTNTAEAFLGSCCHDALEKLYNMTKFQKVMTLQELLDFFDQCFSKWDDVKIIREGTTKENYHAMGIKFLTDYHKRYHPFNHDRLISCEERVLLRFGDDNRYQVQGYIDRLSKTDDGTYYVIDYKTANSLPSQGKMDEDRQLALYSIAVKERFPEAKRIRLRWHYLAFDEVLESERDEEELEALKSQVMALIDEIESAKDFPPKQGPLCSWCEYRYMCPHFKHLYKIEKLVDNEFANEDGVVLVNKYMKLSEELKCLQEKVDRLKDAMFDYGAKEGMRVLYGNTDKVTLWSKDCVKLPAKRDPLFPELVKLLKSLGKFEDYATIDTWDLGKSIENGELDDVKDMLAGFMRTEQVRRIYPSRR